MLQYNAVSLCITNCINKMDSPILPLVRQENCCTTTPSQTSTICTSIISSQTIGEFNNVKEDMFKGHSPYIYGNNFVVELPIGRKHTHGYLPCFHRRASLDGVFYEQKYKNRKLYFMYFVVEYSQHFEIHKTQFSVEKTAVCIDNLFEDFYNTVSVRGKLNLHIIVGMEFMFPFYSQNLKDTYYIASRDKFYQFNKNMYYNKYRLFSLDPMDHMTRKYNPECFIFYSGMCGSSYLAYSNVMLEQECGFFFAHFVIQYDRFYVINVYKTPCTIDGRDKTMDDIIYEFFETFYNENFTICKIGVYLKF